MKKTMTLALAAMALALPPVAPLQAQEQPSFNTKIASPQAPQLVAMLREGGYVIYFRHGSTPDYREPKVEDFADCSRQRNLNSIGRYQAFLIGEGFRNLAIPVGEIFSSPYCRSIDTARIAFGRYVIADELRDGNNGNDKVRARFSDKVPAGTNRLIFGHGGAGGMLGDEFLREAEGVVVRPLGDGKFELIARVRSEQWAQFEDRNRLPPPGAPVFQQ
jgi:broad specificity phosphatase PhoE